MQRTESDTIDAKNLIVRSKLPATDYVINPYVGCRHACQYCYAEFMNRFYDIGETWGTFVKKKVWTEDIAKTASKLRGKRILFGSVTDVYQPAEKKYQLMRQLLPMFIDTGCEVEILTKSPLVLRDLDILSELEGVTVGISLATLDDEFHRHVEHGTCRPRHRLDALEKLTLAGVDTYLFVSPIFPALSNVSEIIPEGASRTDTICFENLNLKGKNRPRIMKIVRDYYPHYENLYKDIYSRKDLAYWNKMEEIIEEKCQVAGVEYRIYFHHEASPAALPNIKLSKIEPRRPGTMK